MAKEIAKNEPSDIAEEAENSEVSIRYSMYLWSDKDGSSDIHQPQTDLCYPRLHLGQEPLPLTSLPIFLFS